MSDEPKTAGDFGFKKDERTSRLIGEDVWVSDESAWIVKKGKGTRNTGCYLRRADDVKCLAEADPIWFSTPEEAMQHANAIEEYANHVATQAVGRSAAKRADGQAAVAAGGGGKKLQA